MIRRCGPIFITPAAIALIQHSYGIPLQVVLFVIGVIILGRLPGMVQ